MSENKPWKINGWNPQMEVWKLTLPKTFRFQALIFSYYVTLDRTDKPIQVPPPGASLALGSGPWVVVARGLVISNQWLEATPPNCPKTWRNVDPDGCYDVQKRHLWPFRFSRRGEISKYSPVFLGTCSLMDSIVCDKLSWIGLEKGMHLKCCNKLMANAFGTEGCEISWVVC